MSRFKENEELINKVNSCFESMEQTSPLEVAGVRDALQAEKEAE